MQRCLYWFRQDLRLADNPAFSVAAKAGALLPVYIVDDINAHKVDMGAASRCWLHHSLCDLQTQLSHKLILERGDPLAILKRLIKQYQIEAVYWDRCYTPWQIERDQHIKATLERNFCVSVHTYQSALLFEPWAIKNQTGKHYRIFTPFYHSLLPKLAIEQAVLKKPRSLKFLLDKQINTSVNNLRLLPTSVRWDQAMIHYWQPSEAGAQNALSRFIKKGLAHYHTQRDIPSMPAHSTLSPYLRFGQLSPNQVWQRIMRLTQNEHTQSFLRQLIWREFSYHLLYYYPDLPSKNLKPQFNSFPWQTHSAWLTAWQEGQTGYPFIDAGMRELWQTGFMHNRLRLLVASFLVKHLQIDWRKGAAWFWDCLVDADLANNSAGWQWVAGCGTDASPYFRIFNPITQGQKFDPNGEYTKKYVPELAGLPTRYLFAPWLAPAGVLSKANIILGQTYPHPIVDHQQARERALNAFKQCH